MSVANLPYAGQAPRSARTSTLVTIQPDRPGRTGIQRATGAARPSSAASRSRQLLGVVVARPRSHPLQGTVSPGSTEAPGFTGGQPSEYGGVVSKVTCFPAMGRRKFAARCWPYFPWGRADGGEAERVGIDHAGWLDRVDARRRPRPRVITIDRENHSGAGATLITQHELGAWRGFRRRWPSQEPERHGFVRLSDAHRA